MKGIRLKISLTYSIVFCIIILFAWFFIYNSINNHVTSLVLNKMKMSLSSSSSIYLKGNDGVSVYESFINNNKYIINSISKSGMEMQLYDRSGNLITDTVHSYTTLSDKENQGLVLVSLKGSNSYLIYSGYIYFCVPILYNTEQIGVAEYILPLDEEYSMLGFIMKSFEITAAAAVIVVVMLNIYLSKILTKPINELAHAASMFIGGEVIKLSSRGNDEVGQLINAFNSMSARVTSQMEELKIERAKLNIVLEGMVEGVVAMDSHGNIMFKNQAFEKVMTESFLQGIIDIFRETTSEGYIIKDIEVNDRIYRIVSAKSYELVVMVISDVTMDRQMIISQKKFAANASHELKTPITSIIGFSQYLIDTEDYNKCAVQEIHTQAQRLKALVDTLLELSRLNDYNSRIDLKTTNLSSIANQIINNMNHKASRYKIEIKSEIEENIVLVLDEMVFSKVIINLIDNAIKYSKPSSTIEVSLVKKDKSIKFAVKDYGIGIPENEQDRIFQRFHRCSNALLLPGTGLGLSIVKEVVELHGGVISFKSKPGDGSEFIVRLFC